MIIERLDLKAFGRFSDFSIDLSAGPRRLHLVYGENETGKSTSLRAITSLLFGMPHTAEDNYLHTNAQLRVGGLLSDESGRRLECVRRRGRKATLRDGDDDEVVDESILADMLGGISRETFLTRFGLSHAELKAGGAAILDGQGDLGQILFAAGAGVGRLREIQSELDKTSNALFNPRGTKAAINVALRELDQTRQRLRQAQIPPAEYSQLGQRIEEKRAESGQIDESIQSTARKLDRLRSYDQAATLLPQWRSTIESIKTLADVPALDEAFSERRRQAMSDREVARSHRKELETRASELAARLEAIPVDDSVIHHEQEIQAVFQEVAARDKADRDRLGLFRNRNNVDRKIIELLRQLSVDIGDGDDDEKFQQIESAMERLQISESRRTRIRELAASRERLIGNRNDLSEAVVTTKRRLAEVGVELETIGVAAETTALNAAIESVGNPQAMLDAFTERGEICDQLRTRCDHLLSRLDGFNGTVKQAARIRPPSATILDRLTKQLRAAQEKVARCDQHARQLRSQREDLDREVRQLQTGQRLPTVEELQQARELRDAAIDRLVQQSQSGDDTVSAIEEVRRSVRTADQLADTIRNHHEQVHRRDTLVARISALDENLADAESSAAAAGDALAAARQEWASTWDECDVKAADPERMQRWIADHEQLRETLAQLNEGEQRLEQTRMRIERASARLHGVLSAAQSKQPISAATTYQGGLFDDPPELDLVACYDSAVEIRNQRQQALRQYETLCRKRDELAAELPEAETRLEAAQKAVEQWREEWQRTTESFVHGERVSSGEVLQMLDQIGELVNKKRERDILSTRIQSIGDDETAFADRVMRLVTATNHPQNDEATETTIAQSLYQRLQAARAATKERASLNEQIEKTNQRLAEVSAQHTVCEATLKQLCEEAGCEETGRLPEIERTARRRAELQTKLQSLENQISMLAADEPFDSFMESAASQQPAILKSGIERNESELRELTESKTTVEQEIGALRNELDRMDGSGRASELSQSIQLTAGQISEDADAYARAKTASLLLRRAIDHYRQENQSPVLAIANGFFSVLTCDEYRELKTDYDAKGKTALYGVNAGGDAVPARAMSDGTADALYLALRLASLEHQMSHGKTIPMIIDDCLVQLDDRRSAAALKALSGLSEKTQVILFTHHRHLTELAAENLDDGAYHLHQLEAR